MRSQAACGSRAGARKQKGCLVEHDWLNENEARENNNHGAAHNTAARCSYWSGK